MAIFKGSRTEFKRFIGPHLRNVVNQITKKHKREVGNCEHCGAGGELQAAHVHGKDRIQIIESILQRVQSSDSQIIEIDIGKFEQEFKNEHSPVEKAILVLCDACHRKYDSKPSVAGHTVDPAHPAETPFSPPPTHSPADLLSITLDPPKPSDFVDQLLRTKTAEIQTYFGDGEVNSQTWNADRFTRDSNLFGNLRSRPEFRQGEWQTRGIAKVHVRVVER